MTCDITEGIPYLHEVPPEFNPPQRILPSDNILKAFGLEWMHEKYNQPFDAAIGGNPELREKTCIQYINDVPALNSINRSTRLRDLLYKPPGVPQKIRSLHRETSEVVFKLKPGRMSNVDPTILGLPKEQLPKGEALIRQEETPIASPTRDSTISRPLPPNPPQKRPSIRIKLPIPLNPRNDTPDDKLKKRRASDEGDDKRGKRRRKTTS
ncbi:hypothetical protein HDU85_002365 [Gaertneriomyces sp. JEL0708]|nr:hypothetical protein HDU85_002365 [Gaertneriomyces sp. JEL0708]